MANKTPIEWVATFNNDGTFTEGYSVNPIRFKPRGSDRLTTMCQKVSPGCTHCYAESIVRRFWSKDADVKFPGYTAAGVASGEFVVDPKQLESILKIKHPAKVFWGDMTDLFHEGIPDWALDKCLAACALTPHLTHMFLTKRPERMAQYILDGENFYERILKNADFFRSTYPKLCGIPISNPDRFPLQNVMLGTSAENQQYFDERIEYIQKLHDRKWKTFFSLEPLLGPIDVEYPKTLYPNGAPMCCNGQDCGCRGLPMESPAIYAADWVIVGAESGHGARPMDEDWVRNIRNACLRWHIPFFYKQKLVNGKKVGTPELDGVKYAQFPEVRA
jgi:protein gp37